MATANSQSSESIVDRLPVAEGASFGAAAWFVGFVTFVVLINLVEDFGESFEGDWWQFSGAIFHNAHFVDVAGEELSMNLLHGDGLAWLFDWTIPAMGYTLLAVVILVGAGYALASKLSIDDGPEAAKAGATIAAGYLPLALVGSFVFDMDGASPELLTSVLLMGVLFPVVLGAVGGYVAGSQ